jgi:hypothetical protein
MDERPHEATVRLLTTYLNSRRRKRRYSKSSPLERLLEVSREPTLVSPSTRPWMINKKSTE